MRKNLLRATGPGRNHEPPRTRITQTDRGAKNEPTERLATVKHGSYWGGGPIAKTGHLKRLNGQNLVVFWAKNRPQNGSTGVLVERVFETTKPPITIPPPNKFNDFNDLLV